MIAAVIVLFGYAMKKAGNKTRWFQLRLSSILATFAMVSLGIVLFQWTQRPRRTVDLFCDLVESGKLEEADEMLECDDGFVISPTDLGHRVRVARSVLLHHSERDKRSLSDLASSRQTYQLKGNSACFVDTGDVQAHWLIDSVTVDNDKIRIHWRGPSDRNVQFKNGKWTRDNLDWFWHGEFAR